ncbi:MAG: glycosyl transferase family 1 [Ilumatobacteraceae bacterium]|nr:glycosyl transferase family 1 [Ilumatobacteraceae bacterium]
MPADPSSSRPGTSPGRIGIVSTYPPKLCGLATFAAALGAGLTRAGLEVRIVRIDDGEDALEPFAEPVVADLVNGDPRSVVAAAAALSACDVAIVQHEYGIYGGVDGDEVITLINALTVPAIVVLHTVPLAPTPHQRSVLEVVVDLADRVVVMSETARIRLGGLYATDSSKVVTIPHGATRSVGVVSDHDADAGTPQLLTWGLLGPGKGIEHMIDALALFEPAERPHYTVAGVTHPKVLARHGDVYRRSLIARAAAAGVADWVTFDDTYRNVPDLIRFVSSAEIVVLPYDSRDQVTSGVLVDAVAAGKPVIATAFPHAIELLGSGAGLVVPQGDAAALAVAVRSALADPTLLRSMEAEAVRLAPSLSWSAVARRYIALADELGLAAGVLR